MSQEIGGVGRIGMAPEDFPFMVLLFDKDMRLGATWAVREPDVMSLEDLPEDGRPWTALTVAMREDYSS